MAAQDSFMIYGATGYTGGLITRQALARGLRPVLGGRDRTALERLGAETGLATVVVDLDDPAELRRAMTGLRLVVHAAGPFSATAGPMVEACIAAGVHYLDITGEVPVFQALAATDARAREAGVMLLPGVGFDVVPTDCLAAHLAARLPGARDLRLAFVGLGAGLSRGTAKTMVESLGEGGVVRRGGRLVRVSAAWDVRTVDFGRLRTQAASIPWGDVVTAWHSTGIGDITVYMGVDGRMLRALRSSNRLGWLLRRGPVRRYLKWRIDRRPPGPDAARRERARALVWGQVTDAAGSVRTSCLQTPEGYSLTALTAVAAAGKVLAGVLQPGFQTPSRVFGRDFILEIPGCERMDAD